MSKTHPRTFPRTLLLLLTAFSLPTNPRFLRQSQKCQQYDFFTAGVVSIFPLRVQRSSNLCSKWMTIEPSSNRPEVVATDRGQADSREKTLIFWNWSRSLIEKAGEHSALGEKRITWLFLRKWQEQELPATSAQQTSRALAGDYNYRLCHKRVLVMLHW